MLRVRTALIASSLCLGACKDRQQTPPPPLADDPVEPAASTPATAQDIRAVAAASYARTLEQQLDLVPPDADLYFVVRDLRPLISQARRVEQVMAGPLARAIPALAKIGGGSGEARLSQLARTRELLALLLAGLEGSGIELDKGMVVAQGKAEPIVLFAAPNLERLGALAGLAGVEVDLASSCGELGEQPGWFACSLGGAEALASYRPAKQGAALAKRLTGRIAGVELDRINVAVSLAETEGSLDAVLRTDPGLWELSMPVPLPARQNLLAVGAAPALRALVPGTSFVWGRIDPTLLPASAEQAGPLDPKLLTGELWFGAVDDPDGFAVQAGISDAGAVARSIEQLAAALPDEPLALEQLDGVTLELDRASIDLDEKRVPSIGLSMTGSASTDWADTLGVPPRVRVWASSSYLSAALGEVQAIPSALERLDGSGPSPRAIANLPPTLARSLLDGEVGLVVHLVLDHWQAPPSRAELDSLLVGVPPERRPDLSGIAALFQSLAPWSSCAVWLRKHGEQWIANVSLVPFAAAGDGVGEDEAAAASMVLDTVLTGGDGQAGYRELLASFPTSPWAYAYRARIGDAPDHHAAVGMVELGLIGALVIPSIGGYIDKARSSEATRETQAILSAALAVRERTGSCDSLIGEAGPTPPLAVECHAGDGGRCRPVDGAGAAAGEYSGTVWSKDPIWSALDYRPDRLGTGSHRYHYSLTGERSDDGCRLRVQAHGDLDGDGVFSTFEREATVGADGAQSITPIRVDQGEE